jgi:hypothetical protein
MGCGQNIHLHVGHLELLKAMKLTPAYSLIDNVLLFTRYCLPVICKHYFSILVPTSSSQPTSCLSPSSSKMDLTKKRDLPTSRLEQMIKYDDMEDANVLGFEPALPV